MDFKCRIFLIKKRIGKPARIAIGVALGLVLLAGGWLLIQTLLDPMDCRMAENVTIGGLDVGGMTRREARDALKAVEKATLLNGPLQIALPGKILEVDPKAAGIRVSLYKAVGDAYRIGRQDKKGAKDLPLSPYLRYKDQALRSLLEDYASKYDTTLTAPQWKLRGQVPELGTDVYDPNMPGQSVELTLGLPERHLDVDSAMEQILRGLDQGLAGVDTIQVEVPCKTEPQAPNLDEIYATCVIAPKNDALDPETHQVIPGSYGYHFDMEKAGELIAQAGYGQTISIPMEAFPPEIWGEKLFYQDVLGSCETKHTDDENRNTNLQLVCQFLDGMVIQSGEEFSYNAAVGERTAERGFMPANAFAGDRMVKDYGGGVCQGSTTLYNCLLLAEMEVTERHGHGAVVTYVPLGLDAAVNWATETDLRFTNTSPYPVKIRAELSGGYMKMQLLGTEERDYSIKLETEQISEPGYIYAGSYKVKYDTETGERLSRERIAFSTYDLSITG